MDKLSTIMERIFNHNQELDHDQELVKLDNLTESLPHPTSNVNLHYH